MHCKHCKQAICTLLTVLSPPTRALHASASMVTSCLFTQPNTPVSQQSLWLTSIVSVKQKATNKTLPNALNSHSSSNLVQLTQLMGKHPSPKTCSQFTIFLGKEYHEGSVFLFCHALPIYGGYPNIYSALPSISGEADKCSFTLNANNLFFYCQKSGSENFGEIKKHLPRLSAISCLQGRCLLTVHVYTFPEQNQIFLVL